MPRRGYRKGVDDEAQPLCRYVRSRVTDGEYRSLVAEAASRSLTHSKLVRAVLVGHLNNARVSLPQDRSRQDEILRQITRIGNNLNQLARQANAGKVPVSAAELERCLLTLTRMAEIA